MPLKPVPKPVFWWPYNNLLWGGDKLRALVRISRTCNIGLQWAPDGRIKDALATKPEILGLHMSPYHDMKDDETIYSYLTDFYMRCKNIKRIIKDQKVEVLLDHELWVATKEDPEVIRNLTYIHDIIKFVFDCPVHWYNHSQIPNSPISRVIPTNTIACSQYYQQGSQRNYYTFNATIREPKQIMVWLSTDLCYEETPWGSSKRSKNITEPNQLGQIYSTGMRMVVHDQVESLCIWPTPTMSDHLIVLFEGMHHG